MVKENLSIAAIKKTTKRLVDEGKLAMIYDKYDDPKYINSYLVVIKCPWCGKMINRDKSAMCQRLNETDDQFRERQIRFLLDEYVKDGIMQKTKNKKYRLTDFGKKYMESR